MARKELLHKKSKRKKRVIALIMTIITAILISFYFLIAPTGNTALRTIMKSNETPLDSIVRQKAIEVSSTKDGDIYESLNKILSSNTIPELIEKTKTETDTVNFLKNDLQIDDSLANDISEEIFSNEKLIEIHNNIRNSNWKDAYNNINHLIENGELEQIKSNLSNESISDVQKLQDEASKILNEE